MLAAEFTKQFYIEMFFDFFFFNFEYEERAWTTTTRPEYSGLLRALDQTFIAALLVVCD